MKIIREYINEKFREDSDPIVDLRVGTAHLIELWINYYSLKANIDRNTDFKDKCVINDDLTIDVNGSISLNGVGIFKLPYYIQFRNVEGDFMINHNNLKNLVGCPYYIRDNFYINGNPIKSLKGFPKKIGHQVIISKSCGITENQLKKVSNFISVYYTPELREKNNQIKTDYWADYRPGKIEDYVFDL
jgi:hypothetical protein